MASQHFWMMMPMAPGRMGADDAADFGCSSRIAIFSLTFAQFLGQLGIPGMNHRHIHRAENPLRKFSASWAVRE